MHQLPCSRLHFPVKGSSALVASFFIWAPMACSAEVGSIFGDEPGAAGGDAQGGGQQQGGSGSGANSGSGASNGPGGNGSGGETNQTVGQGAAPPDTSTTDATTDSSTSSGRPEETTVPCGGEQCSVEDGGVCCFDLQANTTECLANAAGCVSSVTEPLVAIACQVPSDCDGDICCAHRAIPAGDSPYDRTACVEQCGWPDLYLCDQSAPDCPIYDTPNGPVQSICKQSQLLPVGYYICSLN